jgi:hypothetical protein
MVFLISDTNSPTSGTSSTRNGRYLENHPGDAIAKHTEKIKEFA